MTVNVKDWVAFVPTPLVAVKVSGYVPPVPAAGMPLNIPVAGTKVTPVGRVPVTERVGAGEPVAVTVNVPAVPTVKVVLFALVMAGGVPKFQLVLFPPFTELDALTVLPEPALENDGET